MKAKVLRGIFFVVVLMIATISAFADNPAPPPPGGDPGSNGGTPVGAPIDGGVTALLVMGVAYGSKKIWSAFSVKNEAE
jgi:hypothetical protein